MKCGWCDGPIPPGARKDAKFCTTRCRQASHRFHQTCTVRVSDGRRLRLAYADPPYPGMAKRWYEDHPDYAGEVDHEALIARLVAEFPDGWALSTSAAALPRVLASCPPGVRVAAWFRGERPTRSFRPLNAWEPVIYLGGRARESTAKERRLDALVKFSRPRLTDPNRVAGAKPAEFAFWIFDLLGALPDDDLVDLFPGSGGIARAWAAYQHGGEASRVDVATLRLDLGPVASELHDASRLTSDETEAVAARSHDDACRRDE